MRSTPTPPVQLARFARSHYGLFRSVELDELGITSGQLRRRLADGTWEIVLRGVYRVAGTPPSWEGSLLAACWSAPSRAAASHRSALALSELPGGSKGRCEVIAERWHRSQHQSVGAHETIRLPGHHLTTIGVIPVTTVERTLVDSAAVLHRSVLESAVDEALRRGLASIQTIATCLEETGVAGRRGARTLLGLLATRRSDPATESPMESRLVRALERGDLPTPHVQHEVQVDGRAFRLDVAYPEARLGIEYDSYLHHGGRGKFVQDLARRNALTAAGWTLLHVTVNDLRDGGRALCDMVRRALDAAA
ncbi:MAG: hypothetical protein U0V73_15885 [Acidimicrobiia bacterium]